mmetsp:Transcript_22856/g.73988  ORF Transcript_22856/g.73988 Transcript_22856/m.73988 type:complete len:208 (-) Transcript_22856:1049-1672(-)
MHKRFTLYPPHVGEPRLAEGYIRAPKRGIVDRPVHCVLPCLALRQGRQVHAATRLSHVTPRLTLTTAERRAGAGAARCRAPGHRLRQCYLVGRPPSRCRWMWRARAAGGCGRASHGMPAAAPEGRAARARRSTPRARPRHPGVPRLQSSGAPAPLLTPRQSCLRSRCHRSDRHRSSCRRPRPSPHVARNRKSRGRRPSRLPGYAWQR